MIAQTGRTQDCTRPCRRNVTSPLQRGSHPHRTPVRINPLLSLRRRQGVSCLCRFRSPESRRKAREPCVFLDRPDAGGGIGGEERHRRAPDSRASVATARVTRGMGAPSIQGSAARLHRVPRCRRRRDCGRQGAPDPLSVGDVLPMMLPNWLKDIVALAATVGLGGLFIWENH